MPSDTADQRVDFIRANTKIMRPPLVPEIELHLAEESLPIWQKTEEELGEMNVPPPFWAFAWAGGQALARYILDERGVVAGKTVLDLGAGSGIAAIAAMRAGARSALAADVDVFSVAACRLNAEVNGVALAVDGGDLLAGDPPGLRRAVPGGRVLRARVVGAGDGDRGGGAKGGRGRAGG